MNYCHLYRATDCAFGTAENYDIYRPSKSGNCPFPLDTRTLIKSDWVCGDGGILFIGYTAGISLDECETLCREEPLCVWF